MKPQISINQTLASAFIVVGAIVLSAIVLRFPGLIELKLDMSGGQVTIDGRQPVQLK